MFFLFLIFLSLSRSLGLCLRDFGFVFTVILSINFAYGHFQFLRCKVQIRGRSSTAEEMEKTHFAIIVDWQYTVTRFIKQLNDKFVKMRRLTNKRTIQFDFYWSFLCAFSAIFETDRIESKFLEKVAIYCYGRNSVVIVQSKRIKAIKILNAFVRF